MGMPLYGMQPPTGYSMKADAWVNSSALLGRMNFALALTAGKLKGVQVDTGQMLITSGAPTDPNAVLLALEADLLAGNVSRQTHDTIAAQINDPKTTPATMSQSTMNQNTMNPAKTNPDKQGGAARPSNTSTIAGLLLGSPEFQRR
jgi:uncharacterized protein (DUF1800 family)